MPVPAPSDPTSAAHKWRRFGLLALTGIFGLSVASLATETLGLFMQPRSDEFGRNRPEASIGLTILALVNRPLTPLAGMLADRRGLRRIAALGLLISGSCFAAFSLMNGSCLQWLLLCMLCTLASLMNTLGAILGELSCLMAGIAGIGPALSGQISGLPDHGIPLLTPGVQVSLVAGLCVSRLGPFRKFAPVVQQAPLARKPAAAH
jgi:hypothetical protein